MSITSNRPSESQHNFAFDYDCSGNGRKRVRYDKFDIAWEALYCSRWPELVKHFQAVPFSSKSVSKCGACDWQQKYWEMHLQNCFDAAAERVMLPSFDGCVGDVQIPGALVKIIGYEEPTRGLRHGYSRLRDHCQEFGFYVRSLRLQNIFCNEETCLLLANSKLQSLLIRRISTDMHLDGLRMILNQNRESITSLEFVNCKISLASLEAIFDTIHTEATKAHGVKHFSVKASRLSEANSDSLPPKLISFLSSRSLESLSLCEDHIGKNFAKLTFMALLDASSGLSTLELSDNNISGWLVDFHCNSSNQGLLHQKTSKSLQSLRVLNLRGNNLRKTDMENLQLALIHMPVLETLDLSDNPFEDEGIKHLIPYFVKSPEHFSLASLNLKNCILSCNGATELLEVLLALKYPLTSLSLADNYLGRLLDIRDIGLGPSGFLELQINMPGVIKLTSIDISENRGGIQAAEFLEELIIRSSELVNVHAGYNLMPSESLNIIYSALKNAKGKLQCINLTGNQKLCQTDNALALSEFQHNGEPIVMISASGSLDTLYDDDP
ncbi:Protein phosphatase 1 regulatory subunit 37-like protein [Bienertia sinuspersici]